MASASFLVGDGQGGKGPPSSDVTSALEAAVASLRDDEPAGAWLRVALEAYRREPAAVAWATTHLDAGDLASSLLAAMPRSSGAEHWDDLVGPFVSSQGAVARLDGVSTRQGVDQRRRSRRVLGCQTGDGTWVYPEWQFTSGGVLPGLESVLAALLAAVDGWTAALWLRTPNIRLAGSVPASMLGDGRGLEAVERAARSQAEAWQGTPTSPTQR